MIDTLLYICLGIVAISLTVLAVVVVVRAVYELLENIMP